MNSFFKVRPTLLARCIAEMSLGAASMTPVVGGWTRARTRHLFIRGVLALALLSTAGLPDARAFPPAPHHTLFGMVRNQWGDPLDVTDATVYLQSSGRDGVRASIRQTREPGINFRLRVPMDSLIRSDLYQATALGRSQPFRLRVQIGLTTYLPLEMAVSSPIIGQPSQSTRIDLTLGVDSDDDGLPDAWEQAIIAMLGGTLDSIRPEGDADGDGISNLNEYLAGTLPFDPSDGFRLIMTRGSSTAANLEFLAIRGRTYSLQSSTDLQQWTPVQFQVLTGATPGPLQGSYSSSDVRYLQVQVPQPAGRTNQYFKAVVQ